MRQPLIGILPLYLKLYDDVKPEVREAFSPFLDTIAAHFQARGLDTCVADICRVRDEFAAAIAKFEREEVALVVTVHLAYSPSLESADILAATQLPLLMLDTTMDADFGQGVSPERIMFNHGIHGVQDLASVLGRADFIIVATPLTPDTRGMIGRSVLQGAKRGAGLVNVGRAGVMDHAALVDLLGSGHLSGAMIDVLPEEPLPPASDHVAGATSSLMRSARASGSPAPARSAAGSSKANPPATLTNMSHLKRGICARRPRTATIMANRLRSTPRATR